MTRRTSLIAYLAVLLALASSVAVPAQAQHFFETERQFVVEKPCEATRSLKGGSPEALQPGDRLTSRGLNKKDGASHVFVRLGSANKWVKLSCGTFVDGTGQSAEKRSAGSDQACLPFFDDEDNPVPVGKAGQKADITPKAPMLNDFDRAVMQVCGPPLKRVTRKEFKDMMREYSHILMELREFTDGRVFADRPARSAPEDYLNDLTDAWFNKDGFNHVFCGEKGKTQNGVTWIGGLHHHGRYLQLQKTQQACRSADSSRYEVKKGLIYSMGVRMKNPAGGELRSPIKGFGLTLSAADIFKIATRALKENPKSKKGKSLGCWLPVSDEGQNFTTVFVRNQRGIITFYPDATPRGPGDHKNPNCRAKIVLDED